MRVVQREQHLGRLDVNWNCCLNLEPGRLFLNLQEGWLGNVVIDILDVVIVDQYLASYGSQQYGSQ